MDSEHAKSDWNLNADAYTKLVEASNLPATISMTNMLTFNQGNNILEVGCGSGIFTSYFLQNLPCEAKYWSVDISTEMLKIAEERKKLISYDKALICHEFKEGNAENLSFVDSDSIDLYISPYCMHCVGDATKMMKEVLRVLKKGSQFAISVLGSKENNTFTSLFGNVLKEIGIVPSNSPKIFELGNKDTLTKLVQDAGLELDYFWVFQNPVPVKTLEEYLGFINGLTLMSNFFNELDQSKKDLVVKGIDEKLKQNKSSHTPLQTEGMFIVGRKP